MINNSTVEVIYPIYGRTLPAEHNYQLYSSLCYWNVRLKEKQWLIKTINGYRDKKGTIQLGSNSSLNIRCDFKDLPLWLDLQGAELAVGGHYFKVGQAEIKTIGAMSNLSSRFVSIKHNGQTANLPPQTFRDCLLYKLFDLGIRCKVRVSADKTMITVCTQKVFGFKVNLSGLSDSASILLQSQGIGGRKRMGGGYFE